MSKSIMPSPVNLSLSFLSHMSRNLMDFIAIQKQSLCLFPPVSIHGQSQILTDLITISARLPSQPNTHFQDCGQGQYLVGVKATTRAGLNATAKGIYQFQFRNWKKCIEWKGIEHLNNLSLIGQPTCSRYSKLYLCYQLATYCRTHAYGFTALGNRNTDLNNYREKNWKTRTGTKGIEPSSGYRLTCKLWFELLWISVNMSTMLALL